MDHATITLIVLGVVAFLFVTELIPVAVTSILGTLSLGVFGVLTPKETFSGLSNDTVVLFAGMFVVGTAMLESGLAQTIGRLVVKRVGTSEVPLMISFMILTIIMSAFASNTGTIACLMPMVIGVCASAKIPATAILMAMAVAANAGGMMTMVGTPPNMFAVSALQEHGLTPFGFFEFAFVGAPIAFISVFFMVFIGRKLLPRNDSDLGVLGNELTGSGSPRQRWTVLAILIFVIYGLIFGIPGLSQAMIAIIGAVACVMTKCITEKQAYKGIDWVTIFLFAGMLPIAGALEKTGAGKMIAESVIGLMGDNPSDTVMMSVLFIISCGLTQFMSNTGTAALLIPIGISISDELQVSPYAVVMAISIATSCAFATPVATPPNVMVMNPAGLHFIDYIKVGTPLCIIGYIVSVFIIPLVWPFNP